PHPLSCSAPPPPRLLSDPSRAHRPLHSFPTRRSSDLKRTSHGTNRASHLLDQGWPRQKHRRSGPASPPCTRCGHDAASPRESWCVQSYDVLALRASQRFAPHAFESTPALTGSAAEVVDPACFVRSSDPAGNAQAEPSRRASPVHGPLRGPYPLRKRLAHAARDRSAATRTAPTAKPQARSAHAAQRRAKP